MINKLMVFEWAFKVLGSTKHWTVTCLRKWLTINLVFIILMHKQLTLHNYYINKLKLQFVRGRWQIYWGNNSQYELPVWKIRPMNSTIFKRIPIRIVLNKLLTRCDEALRWGNSIGNYNIVLTNYCRVYAATKDT